MYSSCLIQSMVVAVSLKLGIVVVDGRNFKFTACCHGNIQPRCIIIIHKKFSCLSFIIEGLQSKRARNVLCENGVSAAMDSPRPKVFRNALTAHLMHCTWTILPHLARTISACIAKWLTAKFPLKRTRNIVLTSTNYHFDISGRG